MNTVMKDGKQKNFTIKINGKNISCPRGCGCNVFHKPDDTDLDFYKCNSCGCTFEAE